MKLFKQVKQIRIKYLVPKIGAWEVIPVVIKVYNDAGNQIAELVNESKLPGIHEIEYDVINLKRGLYFYQVYAGNYVSVRELIVLK